MNDYDVNACMSAFGKFCDEVEGIELVSIDDSQYWVFERGYKAAMEEMIKTIQAGQLEKTPLQLLQTVISKQALH